MNEDEKKAIKELKKVRWNSFGIVVKNEDGKMDISFFTEKHKKTILNLIEKQQKEIQNLQTIDKEHQKLNGELRDEIDDLKQLMAHKNGYTKKLEEDLYENASNYVVSKDKIRERIKELEGQEDWYIENKSLDDLYGRIDELKELLEEE